MAEDNATDIIPVKQEIIRNEQGRFVAGVSGNPHGRPRKGMTLTDITKEILEEELPSGKTRKEALVRKVLDLAYEGNETMIRLAWAYVDGLPKQRIEGEIDHRVLTYEDILKIIRNEYVDTESSNSEYSQNTE